MEHDNGVVYRHRNAKTPTDARNEAYKDVSMHPVRNG